MKIKIIAIITVIIIALISIISCDTNSDFMDFIFESDSNATASNIETSDTKEIDKGTNDTETKNNEKHITYIYQNGNEELLVIYSDGSTQRVSITDTNDNSSENTSNDLESPGANTESGWSELYPDGDKDTSNELDNPGTNSGHGWGPIIPADTLDGIYSPGTNTESGWSPLYPADKENNNNSEAKIKDIKYIDNRYLLILLTDGTFKLFDTENPSESDGISNGGPNNETGWSGLFPADKKILKIIDLGNNKTAIIFEDGNMQIIP